MIHHKSGHPVEIKKISIRLWTIRDEIESALERRLKECEALGAPLYIEDIKAFYHQYLGQTHDHSNVLNFSGKVANFMEELGKEAQSETVKEVEDKLSEQELSGSELLENHPLKDRPFTRQAPDVSKTTYGFTLLSDINMENMLCFTKDKFLHGQAIVVEFLIPQHFILNAQVNYCHHFAMRSRIISDSRPDYRLQANFTYPFKGERDSLRHFLKSISPVIQDDKKTSSLIP